MDHTAGLLELGPKIVAAVTYLRTVPIAEMTTDESHEVLTTHCLTLCLARDRLRAGSMDEMEELLDKLLPSVWETCRERFSASSRDGIAVGTAPLQKLFSEASLALPMSQKVNMVVESMGELVQESSVNGEVRKFIGMCEDIVKVANVVESTVQDLNNLAGLASSMASLAKHDKTIVVAGQSVLTSIYDYMGERHGDYTFRVRLAEVGLLIAKAMDSEMHQHSLLVQLSGHTAKSHMAVEGCKECASTPDAQVDELSKAVSKVEIATMELKHMIEKTNKVIEPSDIMEDDIKSAKEVLELGLAFVIAKRVSRRTILKTAIMEASEQLGLVAGGVVGGGLWTENAGGCTTFADLLAVATDTILKVDTKDLVAKIGTASMAFNICQLCMVVSFRQVTDRKHLNDNFWWGPSGFSDDFSRW